MQHTEQTPPVDRDVQKLRKARKRKRLARNRRLQGQTLAVVLLGTILVLGVIRLFSADLAYSVSENRKLAQKPDFSWSSLADGSYFSAWESYVADQLPGRDRWITAKVKTDVLLGRRESNGVYLCDSGYLMEIPSAPDEKSLSRNVDAINAFTARHSDLHISMTIAPNAYCVLEELLPENAPTRDQRADLAALRQRLTGLSFLDVTDALSSHKDEQLYYRTDHHWTTRGARRAFEAMAPGMNIANPVRDYEIYTVSDSFEGTMASKSGSHDVQDTIELLIPKSPVQYMVTETESKQTTCTLFNRECLNDKDQYTVFLGGNHARVDIETTADSNRVLLVFKDSYANCFMPFLTPYYDTIIMIDPRYYYGSADSLISLENVTDVLFLYNASTFFGDTSLADVLDVSES